MWRSDSGTIRISALCAAWLSLFAAVAHADRMFTDDAAREVQLPDKVARVFAAGAPSEVLLYTLAPEKMVGRNHMPEQAALEFTPPELRAPVQINRLPNARNAQNDAELLALKPDVYVDYGDINEDYVTSVTSIQQRTGVPGMIMNGALENIPATYRKLGKALDAAKRGAALAKEVERILRKYHNVLLKQGAAPRVYMACSSDGFIPCLQGERNGEIVQWLGALNVAGSTTTAPMRPLTRDDLQQQNPDVIILGSSELEQRWLGDAQLQSVKAIAAHRVYVPPAVPFGWGPRPPSVNRLMGMMWLAYVLPGKPFDAAFRADVRKFFQDFYHVKLTDEQLRRLIALP